MSSQSTIYSWASSRKSYGTLPPSPEASERDRLVLLHVRDRPTSDARNAWRGPVLLFITTMAWLGVTTVVVFYYYLKPIISFDCCLSYFTWGERVEPLPISIWLIPPQKQMEEISPFINEFAKIQSDASAPFLPHITITWGGTVETKEQLFAVAHSLQDQLLQDDLLKNGIDCQFETLPQTTVDHDHVMWTQAFVLKMKISSSFERICQQSRRALKMDDDLSFCHNPHMSLLYTNDYPSEEVHEKADNQLDLPLKFTAKRVAVYSIDPVSVQGVKDWELVSEFYLGR